MLHLATPIVLSEVGWMAMGIVDTIMVGHQPDSAAAIGGVSLSSILFYGVGLFGSGISLGLDPLVSQAFGRKDIKDCHRSLINALYFSVPLSLVLMAVLWGFVPLIRHSGLHPSVVTETVPYLTALTWGIAPLLFYLALRHYLQGMNIVRPVTFALITANVVNLVGNWVLIYGHWGLPAMGSVGSAWATVLARIYMMGVLVMVAIRHNQREQTGLFQVSWRPDFQRVAALIRLGLPAATQIGVETAVFALTAWLIGRLNPESLAAHQIALNTVSLTFLVSLGVSSAASVRVGQALGRREPQSAWLAGWTAMGLSVAFMATAALTFLLFSRQIVLFYSSDPAVLEIGAALLTLAAFFQIFDGIQVVVTGALRGAGDTRTPMFCHAIGYWAFGLPLGWLLCFKLGWGARGLWAGLSVAIIAIGCALLYFWKKQTHSWKTQVHGTTHGTIAN